MKILLSGGGTGGGTYPALAVASAIRARYPGCDFLWIGSPNGIEKELVGRTQIAFRGVPSGPLVGTGLLRRLWSIAQIGVGTVVACGIVLRYRPQALLMTGGWPVLPATLACLLLGIPVMIYLPDLEPGAAIRAIGRYARLIAVNSPDSMQYFRPGQAVACGYPLRPELLAAAGYDVLGQPLSRHPDLRQQALSHFNLETGRPTLLVYGGSKGARSINQAVADVLPAVLRQAQVIHITGGTDWEWVSAQPLDADLTRYYHPFPFLHTAEMALALSAADLAVTRSGASVLGEFPLFGLPAILVPLVVASAKSWHYQQGNAGFLVERGAARRIDDQQLATELLPMLEALLANPAARQTMADAMRSLARPDAAARIADLLIEMSRQ